MNQIFLDTNIFLDFYLKRSPFDEYARKILNLIFQSKIKGYISALSYANIFYYLRKENPRDKIIRMFKTLRTNLITIAIDEVIIDDAMQSEIYDFEDAIQYFCALRIPKLDAIVTRNEKDFKKGSLIILNPEEFLHIYKSNP